jgi:hypothetical protein
LEGQADWTQEVKRRGELTQAASMELGRPVLWLAPALVLQLAWAPLALVLQLA